MQHGTLSADRTSIRPHRLRFALSDVAVKLDVKAILLSWSSGVTHIHTASRHAACCGPDPLYLKLDLSTYNGLTFCWV
jgi:hypothetical protein